MCIYYLPITSTNWNQTDNQLLKYVSPQRQKRISKFVFDVDKKLTLYSGLIIRWALSNMSEIPVADLRFYSEPNQKPHLLPISSLDFSISHTRNAILCCLSSTARVGADIEKIADAPFEIMKHAFHFEEIKYVENAPVSNADYRFYEIWTRKEAYTKSIGTGLSEKLSAINTLASDFTPNFRTWQEDSYMCSVFSEKPFEQISFTTLSENFIAKFYLPDYNSP